MDTSQKSKLKTDSQKAAQFFDSLLKQHEPKGEIIPPNWFEYVVRIDHLHADGDYDDALRLEVEYWQKKSNYYFDKFVSTNTRLQNLMEKLREQSQAQ